MQRSCVFLYELFLHWPRCINKVDIIKHCIAVLASSAKMWHNRRIHVAAHDVRPPLYLSLYTRAYCEIRCASLQRDCSKGKNFTFKSNHVILVSLLSQVENTFLLRETYGFYSDSSNCASFILAARGGSPRGIIIKKRKRKFFRVEDCARAWIV